MTTTDITAYEGTQLGQYQAGIIMDVESVKALDEQVRRCTEAVLREGTDYGVIPGTGGEKTLWRPGAQKLLQWFGLGFTCERVEVERDDDGRKHGITYKCTVARRLPDGTLAIKATCEGTADYDESKFYQTAEEVQAKAEARERMWAKKDGRVANPTKWKGDPSRDIPPPGEYRADWNALMKRAQKRAIVGATSDATAAGGIFSDREEDDSRPATASEPDGLAWYEQAIQEAYDFTTLEAGRELYVEAQTAYREGACSRHQMDRIQNIIRKRGGQLKKGTPVDVEDLARQAAGTPEAEPDPTSPPAATSGNPATSENAQPATPASTDPENEPGSASEEQLQALHITLGGLGFTTADRDAKLNLAETITGRELTGPVPGRSSKNLSHAEARKLTDTLSGFGGDREKLIAYMAGQEQDGDGDG